MDAQAVNEQAPSRNNFAVLALKELSKVDKGLDKLRQTYGNVVYDVTTAKGMEQAKKARQSIRQVRYSVENIRKDEASRIAAAQKALNAEAERIKTVILEIENPIDAQINAEEERKQREKEEAERKEAARVAAIRAEIDSLAGTPARVEANGLSIAEIGNIIAALGSSGLDAGFYQEFLAEAEYTRNKVIGELHTLKAKIQLREEEAARIAAQQAENERLRQQLAEMQAMVAKLTAGQSTAIHSSVESALVTGTAAAKVEISDADPVFTGVTESLYKGEPIDPATESWSAIEASAGIDQLEELRIFKDEYPGTEKIVFAVMTQLGVTKELAESYIVRAGEDLAF